MLAPSEWGGWIGGNPGGGCQNSAHRQVVRACEVNADHDTRAQSLQVGKSAAPVAEVRI